MNKRITNFIFPIFLLVLSFFLFPSFAKAATLTIWPNNFGSQTTLNFATPFAEHWKDVNAASDSSYVANIYIASYLGDLYALDDPTGGARAGTINKVTAYARVWVVSLAGGETAKVFMRTNNTNYAGVDQSIDWTIENISVTWTDNPATGQAWTWADIDNLQSGVQLKGASNSITVCSQVFVEIDFTVANAAPTVSTNAASSIQSDQATINGNLVDMGGIATANVWFEWGETTAYGNTTPSQPMAAAGTFSATITGLDSHTTYHFRAVAQNSIGTSYGADSWFDTLYKSPTVLGTQVLCNSWYWIKLISGNCSSDSDNFCNNLCKGYGYSSGYPTNCWDNSQANALGIRTCTIGGNNYEAIWGNDPGANSYAQCWCPLTVPTVVTDVALVDIENNIATLKGNVINTGGENPDHRYIDWDTDASGVPYANAPDLGAGGVGIYSKNISIAPNVTYYYRARAHNSNGDGVGQEKRAAIYTIDGAEVEFSTLPFYYTLSVLKLGSSGTITSSPTGIDCGSDCSESYKEGTSVTLTAAPSSGYIFDGWGGDCSGTGNTCVLTINSDKNVTAVFNANPVGFDFSISVNPTSDSISQGNPISATVNTVLSGITQSVSFNASNLPSGASASFSPTSCSPPCSSVMTINTSGTTPVGGPYSINICGTSCGLDGTCGTPDDITHCVNYNLTVTQPVAGIIQPSVSTGAATAVTQTSATLNGNLNGMGNAASCLVWFEWGETASYGNSTLVQTKTATGAFSTNLTELLPNTTYYFKARAKNGGSW